jgi:UDP-N-acetylmuramyl pentapeptide synthase
MAALLADVLRAGDVVLVKGSRRIGLEAVVGALAASLPSRGARARG